MILKFSKKLAEKSTFYSELIATHWQERKVGMLDFAFTSTLKNLSQNSLWLIATNKQLFMKALVLSILTVEELATRKKTTLI
ncbi:hypothetical protein REPUB_Repub12eG0046900 [Reevesia pubescens]